MHTIAPGISLKFSGMLLLSWLAVSLPHRSPAANEREEAVRNDRKIAEAGGPWVYNDLEKGRALARASGKPMFVVFRCPP